MTWQDANNFCASQYGTTLATITSEEEVAELQNLINVDSAPRFYIGLNDHESEGTWKWASGYECDAGNCASEGWLPWCDFNGIVAPWSLGSVFGYNDDDCGEIANANDVWDWNCAESVYDGDCSFARPFFCDKPAPPTFFVNYGVGCNGLGVEDMHGGGTGEYEDCVCDAFFEGARAVTVAEAITGSVSFPESAVPELHSPKYLTFSCRDEPSPDVCSDEAGSDHRWGVESGTALPSSGVPASSFVRYDLFHTNNEGERLNGYLLCVPPEATSVPTDAATSSHWVVAGHPLDSVWISRDDEYSEILPLVECVEDSSRTASISAGEGPQIAVTCCNDDGSLLPAEDDPQTPYWGDQTFSEAKGFCESLDGDYRLCTRTELLSRKFANEVMGNKNGERYNWVSDECALSTEPEEPTTYDGFEMIERHRNVADGYFSSGASSGIENADNPDANTYCVIGALDSADYLQDGAHYEFKLIYKYSDGSEDVLEWTQTSWLTAGSITGADLSKIVDSEANDDNRRFRGLGRSNSGPTLLDGNGNVPYWWHAVASNRAHNGGIPAHQSRIAYSSELWVRVPAADDVECECPSPSPAPAVSAHYLARGKADTNKLPNDPEVVFYCENDEESEAAYASTRATIAAINPYLIGVRCCNDDGEGWSPATVSESLPTACSDEDFEHAATFAEANQMCTDNGYRLCTLQEMLSGMTEDTGCYYNHVYNWVSDACQLSSAASAAVSAPYSGSGGGSNAAAAASSGGFIPLVVGASIGVLVIAGIVAFAVLMKRKRSGNKKEAEMAKAAHVPEASPASADGVETI